MPSSRSSADFADLDALRTAHGCAADCAGCAAVDDDIARELVEPPAKLGRWGVFVRSSAAERIAVHVEAGGSFPRLRDPETGEELDGLTQFLIEEAVLLRQKLKQRVTELDDPAQIAAGLNAPEFERARKFAREGVV